MKTDIEEAGKCSEREGTEVYVLKIYRRSFAPDESLVGTIEDVKSDRRHAFKTEKDLLKWIGGAALD